MALVTRDRPDRLARCLQSWRAQSSAPFEIVVSDDSSPANTRAVEELASRFACRYVPGPRRGLYANRNHSSLHCEGTHIISADDDHTHPTDYVCCIRELLDADPGRVWIFAERHPDFPCAPLRCPPELHPSGAGQSPADPAYCAAIADGATVYPRAVFESGLRYDETYPFGPLWYLWGQQLVRHGWRISFSKATFVWHHIEAKDARMPWNDFKQRLEASTYAAWVYALWLNPSASNALYALGVTARRLLASTPIAESDARCRLDLASALRAFRRARAAGSVYSGRALTAIRPSFGSNRRTPSHARPEHASPNQDEDSSP